MAQSASPGHPTLVRDLVIFQEGCPELSGLHRQKMVPPSFLGSAQVATHLISDDWVFQTYSWSVRGHNRDERLEYIDVIYFGAGGDVLPNRRLSLRTWFAWDDQESRFPGNKVAEHLYLYLLERDGWPLDQVYMFVAGAEMVPGSGRLEALGAASTSVPANVTTTMAWDDPSVL